MVPSARELLATIDPLPHPARVAVVVRTGLDGAGRPELDTLLDDLADRGPWERLVSLRVAVAAGHLDHVRRCLDAGESALAAYALVAGVRLGLGADELAERLPAMPAALRGVLVRSLRAGRASATADALLVPLRDRFGDGEAGALLPACSAAVVARELGPLAFAVRSWGTLARRHPEVVLDHVERELGATPAPTWRGLLEAVAPGLVTAAAEHPARVLAILRGAVAAAGRPAATDAVLPVLARHDPAGVRDLLLAPGQPARRPTGYGGSQPMSRRLWRALAVLDDDSLARLARPLRPAELARVLRVLPPARRPAVYLALRAGRDESPGAVHVLLLDELPAALRHAEAARLLARRGVGDDPRWRLSLTARLAWPEAEPALREATARPLAEDRSSAYHLLVLAAWATRDPAVVESVVASLDRLRNDQEPVRVGALDGLARVSPRLLTDAAARALGGHLSAALQARDASGATRSSVQWIATRLVTAGLELDREPLVEVGLRALEDAGGHLAHVGLRAGAWPRGSERRVYDALLPRIAADGRVGRHGVLLDLAEALGERAWPLADLQQRLAEAARARDDDVVRRAVRLRLADPATRDDRVAEVLRGDPSTITIAEVARAVATRRTDLLDAVLTRRQRGRFLGRGVRHVPAIAEHAGRWVPRQVERYRRLLVGIVDDPEVGAWERAETLELLAGLPGAVDDVRRHLDDPVPQLADAALTALARSCEPGRVVGDLVARADGDRAHVAFSALTRAARYAAPDELGPALVRVLRMGKVTARKEVCRLLARHRVPDAAGLLVAELTRAEPDGRRQHRDVRRAVVSSLRLLLDDERSWVALTAAATDPALATAILGGDPEELAPRHRSGYALLVGEVAGSADPDVSAAGLQALTGWVRWDPSGTVLGLASRLATDLDHPASTAWRPALAVVLAAARFAPDPGDPGAPGPLLAVVAGLIAGHDERDATPDPDDGAGEGALAGARDLPARQRLEHLVGAWRHEAATDPVLASAGAAGAELLVARPLLLDLAVELAVGAVRWSEPGAPARLGRVVDLCPRPLVAAAAARLVRAGLLASTPAPAPEALDELVRPLVDDPRPEAALVALAVVEAAAGRGWTPALRERLRDLRRHRDPDVRLAASGVHPVSE